MKNKNITSGDEIDLTELFKVLWNKKIKIALITLIIFIIISAYNNYRPKQIDTFKNSLVINPAKEREFLSFIPIYSYLNLDMSNKIVQTERQDILERFIVEFLDYEELTNVLENNESIKKSISHLSFKDKQQKLYNYAKFFIIEKQITEFPSYILTFSWQGNNKEIIDILDQALKLTLINLKNSIFLELNNQYQRKKDSIISTHLKRIEFLEEQSLIAKELQIPLGSGKIVNLGNSDSTSGQINISTSNTNYDSAYYLRGYKAIDMEINFLKKHKFLQLQNIEKKIKYLEEKDIKWVNYNIYLLNTKLHNKESTLSPFLSAALGLLIGILYVLISNNFQSYKVTRKK
jgi:LPS O-antigen subunit length determinant protein (WzzB/FepE family)